MSLVEENLPLNAGDIRGVGFIPGSGRFPGWGCGKPLQYFCLGNLRDREPGRLSMQAKLLRSALIQYGWCLTDEIRTETHTEGRLCEDTGRRQPSTCQGGKPQEKPILLTLSFQNCEKIIFCCINHSACVIYYCSHSILIHYPCKEWHSIKRKLT